MDFAKGQSGSSATQDNRSLCEREGVATLVARNTTFRGGAGSHFDPAVVDLMPDLFESAGSIAA